MSLINDALKRAQEAQDQTPPPSASGPQLRPAEPTAAQKPRRSLLNPILVLTLLVLCALGVWGLVSRLNARPQKPALIMNDSKRTDSTTLSANQEQSPANQPAVSLVKNENKISSPAGQTVSVGKPSLSEIETPKTERPSASPLPVAPPEKTPVEVQAPSSPLIAESRNTPQKPVAAKSPALKLQGIFYSPKKPAAMINGKTVFVGDQIESLRVVAIDQYSATLSGSG